MSLTKSRYRMTGGTAINVVDYRSPTDSNPDWYPSFNDAVASGAAEVYVPPGVYPLSAPIYLRHNQTLRMASGAILRATAVMDAVITTAEEDYHYAVRVIGGKIECNDFAACGIWLRLFAYCHILDTEIWDSTLYGIRLGSNTAIYSSYEAIIRNFRISRFGSTPAPTYSTGIYFEKCGDSHLSDGIIMGQKYGVSGNINDSKITRVHLWNTLDHGEITIGFGIGGVDNQIVQCQVDGPLLSSAYYLPGQRNHLIGCSLNYTGPSYGGVDLQALGVFIEPNVIAVIEGCNFKSQSNLTRLAADIDGGFYYANLTNNTTVNAFTTVGSNGPAAIRAWVCFNGRSAAAIHDQYGVLSVGVLGVGNYRVTLARTMLTTGYSVQLTGQTDGLPTNGVVVIEQGRSANTIDVLAWDVVLDVAADLTYCSVLFVGR